MERKATVFNEAQLYLLMVFSRIKTEKELSEIKKLISNYFAKKAEKQIAKIEKEKGALFNDEELNKLVYGKTTKTNTKTTKSKNTKK